MGKLFTPQDVSSGFNTTNSLNTNFTNIETALDKCLSRTGETPNTMSAALDMNNNNLINAGLVSCDTLEVAGAEVPSLQSLQNLLDTTESDLAAQVTLAQGHATDASQSATDAATAQGLAETAQGLAEDAQAAAEAAVGSIDLPVISPGDAGKILEVNAAGDGYDLLTQVASTQIADASVTTAKLASDVQVPVLLSTTNITAVSSIDMASAFSSNPGYKYYKVVVEDAGFDVNADLWLRISINGSSFLGTSIYGTDPRIVMTAGSMQASMICYTNLLFVNVENTSHQKLANGHTYLLDSNEFATDTAYTTINSSIRTLSAITGFQLIPSISTNFRAQGAVKVYGSNQPF